jgi:hypothetical protein
MRKVFAPPGSGFASALPGLVRVTLSCVNMRGLYGWSKNRDLARARARVLYPLTRFLGKEGLLYFGILSTCWEAQGR